MPIPMTTILMFSGIAIIMLTFFFAARKSSSSQLGTYAQFLEDERAANSVRRKDPSPEVYLKVDADRLPARAYPDEQDYKRVRERQQNTLALARQPMICSLRGLDNRELKLKYGVANLDMLITYEENYNRFIHNLLEWAVALIALGNSDDAAVVLDIAIDCACDRSQAYTLLADIFLKRGESERLTELRARAQENLRESALTKALSYIDNCFASTREGTGI